MPIYEYSCKKCGDFEVSQRMTEEPLKKCPTCGAKVTKLISQSAFHLKGSGWYATDFKNPPAKEKPANAESKPAEDKQTESKQAESKQPGSKERSTTAADSTAPKSTPAPVQPVSESQS